MKLTSEIIKDQKGKIQSWEEYVYNDIGNVVRQDYKDENGKREVYKLLEHRAT